MPANISGLPFDSVWAVDFEFRCPDGNSPTVACMVAKELNSGRVMRLWQDELDGLGECPFDTGKSSLVLTYYGVAEASCFLSLGWALPTNHLDLFVEFCNHTNGLRNSEGRSLVAALQYYNLAGISCFEKHEMRDLIINNESYTDDQKDDILDYCQTDVEALEKLLPVCGSKKVVRLPVNGFISRSS